MRLFKKEKKGNKRIITILGIKISYNKNKKNQNSKIKKTVVSAYPTVEAFDDFKRIVLKEFEMIRGALADEDGIGKLRLMMHNLLVPRKYEYIFYKMRAGDVCIDCGANVGLFTDIVKEKNGICYSFEPNISLYDILQNKYGNDDNITVLQKAVYDRNTKLQFKMPGNADAIYSFGSLCGTVESIEKYDHNVECFEEQYEVEAIDLSLFVKDILQKHGRVYVLKIDIEGAEFDVLKSLIRSGLCDKIDYILCETHARFFADGLERLDELEKMIKENNIKNIFLDWA